MQSARSIRVGAALGALAVLAGAFGAHALQGRLADKALATYEVAVRYQTYHALALVLCGLLAERGWRTAGAARAFAAGVLVFSGSLYVLVLTGATWLGAVTPLGGVLLALGWALLALGGRGAPATAEGAR
ncbi:MAG: DUF423 domain-containing protein [Phycisphaerales bacterium]|nr:DUF423 domain-containing protein [Phycisphaerales bacterium]